MSALHEAVARAIADERFAFQSAISRSHTEMEVYAAAAIRVVLAEAQRSIEALAEKDGCVDYALPEVLAVLAALGEQA